MPYFQKKTHTAQYIPRIDVKNFVDTYLNLSRTGNHAQTKIAMKITQKNLSRFFCMTTSRPLSKASKS